MNTTVLVGAESVERAAARISSAAEQMNAASTSIQFALHRHQQWMDDWLQRFEAVLAATEQRREKG